MSQELLSICIPTRNRARFLRDILGMFSRQLDAGNIGPEKVVFYFSDNASDDETPDIIGEFAKKFPATIYSRNPVNVGAGGNIVHIPTLAKGKYRWLVGDDEILCEGAVAAVVRMIEKHQPGLIIAYDTRYSPRIATPQVFESYREFARECIHRNPHALAEHSLISSNIFRADCFDPAYAKQHVNSFFPHMFGMIRPLLKNRGRVVIAGEPIITVREARPGPEDGEWMDIDKAWVSYFTWLRDELELPELDPHAPSEWARREMRQKILRNPVSFVLKNWRSIFQPQAYAFAYNRLFRRRR